MLEKSGRLFFAQMRPLFFFILGIFPILLSAFILFQENEKIQDLENRFTKAIRKEKIALERKARKERFLKRYSNPDPYFLDRQIEDFAPLKNERMRLESFLHHPAFPESPQLKTRLAFINQNRLAFAEENMKVSSSIKEVEEKLLRPVQVDESDLKYLISLIEDIPNDQAGISSTTHSRPQLLITDFRLKRKITPLQAEVFEVEMDLIKREFIKK